METKINNWIQQEKYFGLDFSTAKATVGDYHFDIRYDADLRDSSIRPDNCALSVSVKYRDKHIATFSGDTVDQLKNFSETYLRKEVFDYYSKHCTMFAEEELKRFANA